VLSHYDLLNYSWSSGICKFTYSLKCICYHPHISPCVAPEAIHRPAQSSGENFESPTVCVPRGGWMRCSAFWFQLSLSTAVLLMVCVESPFPCFCAFYWWFQGFRWPPGVDLEYSLVFPGTRTLGGALENTCARELRSGMITVLLAVRSVLMNQQ